MTRTAPLLALVGLLGLGVAGFLYSTSAAPPAARVVAPPEDDLEMLARVLDASAPRATGLLAVDDANVYVARGASGVVEARPKAGGPARTLATLGSPATGMAIAGGSIWIAAGRSVRRIPLAGGSPAVVFDRLARAGAIAADGQWVFVVDVEGGATGLLATSSLLRVPAAGGDAVVLGRTQGPVASLAIDEANVYWTDALEGAVLAVPKAGGTARTVAADRGLPEQVTVMGDSLVWVERRSESLFAAPKAGGAPRSIVQDFAGFAHVVAMGHTIAWIDEAAVGGAFRVLAIDAAGGDVLARSPPVDAVDALATDGAHLFWLRGDEAVAVP